MSFPSQREQGKGQASGDRGHPRALSPIAPRLESRAMLRVEDEPPEEGAGSGPAVGRWTMSVRPKALPVPSLPLKFPAFTFVICLRLSDGGKVTRIQKRGRSRGRSGRNRADRRVLQGLWALRACTGDSRTPLKFDIKARFCFRCQEAKRNFLHCLSKPGHSKRHQHDDGHQLLWGPYGGRRNVQVTVSDTRILCCYVALAQLSWQPLEMSSLGYGSPVTSEHRNRTLDSHRLETKHRKKVWWK